jgi:hypothetical protein
MTLNERIAELVVEATATVTVNTCEAGLIYTITSPGVSSVRITAEWGDDEDAVINDLRIRMDEAGMFLPRHEYLLDYGSGRTARIRAQSERQAIRIASQGEPESITNLTTGEIKAWVVV